MEKIDADFLIKNWSNYSKEEEEACKTYISKLSKEEKEKEEEKILLRILEDFDESMFCDKVNNKSPSEDLGIIYTRKKS